MLQANDSILTFCLPTFCLLNNFLLVKIQCAANKKQVAILIFWGPSWREVQ